MKLVTRPSNEMLNHWVNSAACSRSSPTAQPTATMIIDIVHYPFPSCSISPLCAHGKTMGHEAPEYKVMDSFLHSLFYLTASLDTHRKIFIPRQDVLDSRPVTLTLLVTNKTLERVLTTSLHYLALFFVERFKLHLHTTAADIVCFKS